MFIKKWWLEFVTDDGREWSGWINTRAENKEDFPETISGTFYTEKDEIGCHGEFVLDDGTKGYVITNKMLGKMHQPKDFSSEEAHRYFDSCKGLDIWERFDRRIEDCLIPSKTYITD